MNALGWFLEATYMAQIGGPIIFVLMVAHFLIAARKMPFAAGEWGLFWNHAKRENGFLCAEQQKHEVALYAGSAP